MKSGFLFLLCAGQPLVVLPDRQYLGAGGFGLAQTDVAPVLVLGFVVGMVPEQFLHSLDVGVQVVGPEGPDGQQHEATATTGERRMMASFPAGKERGVL